MPSDVEPDGLYPPTPPEAITDLERTQRPHSRLPWSSLAPLESIGSFFDSKASHDPPSVGSAKRARRIHERSPSTPSGVKFTQR